VKRPGCLDLFVFALLCGCSNDPPRVIVLQGDSSTGTQTTVSLEADPSSDDPTGLTGLLPPPDVGGNDGTAADSGAFGLEMSSSSGDGGDFPMGPVDLDMDGCPDIPQLELTLIEQFSQTPIAFLQASGDRRRLVAERPGRVLVRDPRVMPAPSIPFLDLRPSVAPLETERGLLGMALHPEFAQNGRFFVVYARAADDPQTPELDTQGDLVLGEGVVSSDDPYVADPTLTILLTLPKDQRFHNGGAIAFGADGYLYMGTGEDGRVYTFERPTLQEIDHRYGKILRIDVDDPEGAPPGNLVGGDPLVWDYGLRNPWRLSFDRSTGDLYIGDVGENSWEEIIFEPAGTGGRNYGWATSEGPQCFVGDPCGLEDITPAVLEIGHTGVGSVDGRCNADFENEPAECNRAVIGGYVYRGQRIRELDGRYFYGDNVQNYVRTFVVRNGQAECEADLTDDLIEDGTLIQGLVSFAEDARGELHVLDLFGHVYRIDREL